MVVIRMVSSRLPGSTARRGPGEPARAYSTRRAACSGPAIRHEPPATRHQPPTLEDLQALGLERRRDRAGCRRSVRQWRRWRTRRGTASPRQVRFGSTSYSCRCASTLRTAPSTNRRSTGTTRNRKASRTASARSSGRRCVSGCSQRAIIVSDGSRRPPGTAASCARTCSFAAARSARGGAPPAIPPRAGGERQQQPRVQRALDRAHVFARRLQPPDALVVGPPYPRRVLRQPRPCSSSRNASMFVTHDPTPMRSRTSRVIVPSRASRRAPTLPDGRRRNEEEAAARPDDGGLGRRAQRAGPRGHCARRAWEGGDARAERRQRRRPRAPRCSPEASRRSSGSRSACTPPAPAARRTSRASRGSARCRRAAPAPSGSARACRGRGP